jgi:SAM-dependent methyltransferase
LAGAKVHDMPADALYRRIEAAQVEGHASPYFAQMTETYKRSDIRHMYDGSLRLFGRSLEGTVCLDFGCKFGHTLPLMLAMGAREAIGVDAHEPYVREGAAIIGAALPQTRFLLTRDGLIDLPSESVDCIYVNEVISHVNECLLPLLYNEMQRILKPGGMLLISDGNNFASATCRDDLIKLYDAWENGPAGTNTGRDVVHESFREQRRKIIKGHAPQLSDTDLDYVAANTFGLYGERLKAVVNRYVSEGKLIERRYRPGIAPTNPGAEGYLMERWFHPAGVEIELATLGFTAKQVYPLVADVPITDLRSVVIRIILFGRGLLNRAFPDRRRGESWGFIIRAVKN